MVRAACVVRWTATVSLAGLASLAWGCERKADELTYACSCDLLTDTDGQSTVRVKVCASGPGRAEARARGCAQSGAPAQIQACACSRAPDACPPRGCQVAEHR